MRMRRMLNVRVRVNSPTFSKEGLSRSEKREGEDGEGREYVSAGRAAGDTGGPGQLLQRRHEQQMCRRAHNLVANLMGGARISCTHLVTTLCLQRYFSSCY